jgi:hypothetical protein
MPSSCGSNASCALRAIVVAGGPGRVRFRIESLSRASRCARTSPSASSPCVPRSRRPQLIGSSPRSRPCSPSSWVHRDRPSCGVGRRWDLDPDARSRVRREGEELPVFLQCPDLDPTVRPAHRGHVRGWAGNRNDPVHDRGSPIEALCKAHACVLADGYRGILELDTPMFAATASCGTAHGADTVAAEPVSSMRLAGSKPGVSSVTIAAVAVTSTILFAPLPSFTTYELMSCGTVLSRS